MTEDWKEINSEEKLKLLQNTKDGSLAFERLCTFTHNIKGEAGPLDQSIECAMLDVRVGMSQGDQNVKYNLKILQYNVVISDQTNPVLKDQSNIQNDNSIGTKDLCKKNQILIRYEAFAKSLNKEFLVHMKSNWKWQESELLETMRCVIAAVQALHQSNLVHGDIRMHSIVLTEDGSVKLADQFCINFDNIYNPSSVIKNDDLLTVSGGLLSPEILKALQDKKLQQQQGSQQLSQQKSILTPECDLWALGVILLEMGLLENVHSHIYDYQNYSIKMNVLGQKINKLKKQLTSKSLVCQLVDLLLNKDPKVRLNAYGFIPLQDKLGQQNMTKQKKRMQNDRYVGIQGMVPQEQVILESDETEEQENSDVSREQVPEKVIIQEYEEQDDHEALQQINQLKQNSLGRDIPSVVVTPVFGIPGTDLLIKQDNYFENAKEEKEVNHENYPDNSQNPLPEVEQTIVEHYEQNQGLISSLQKMFLLDQHADIAQNIEGQLQFQQQTTFVSTEAQQNESKQDTQKLLRAEIIPNIEYSSSYDFIPIPVFEALQEEQHTQTNLISQNNYEILQASLTIPKQSQPISKLQYPLHNSFSSGSQILLLKPSQTIFQQKLSKSVTPFESSNQHNTVKQSPTNSTAPSVASSEDSKIQQNELFISPSSLGVASCLEMKNIKPSSAQKIKRKPYRLIIQGGEEEQDENIDTSNINNNNNVKNNNINNKITFPSPTVHSKQNNINMNLLNNPKTSNTNQQQPFYFPSKTTPQPGIFLLKSNNISNTKHKLHRLSTDNTSSNNITNISNQHGALTEVFNSISPIRDSHSKILLNRSSINEWMHESTNSTASQQSNARPSNFTANPISKTIDEKLAHLDKVCEDALRKSVENRTMIEEMMKKKEISQTNLERIKDKTNLTSMSSSISSTPSSASFERCSNQTNSSKHIRNNINTMNTNNYNSIRNSNHNTSRCSDCSDHKKSFDGQQQSQNTYSAEENLKLSAHFGSLALSHLVSYIHSNSSKVNQPKTYLSSTLNDCSCRNHIDTNSSYQSSLSSSGQYNNQQQMLNEKLLKTLFADQQNPNPIEYLMQSSSSQSQSALRNNP